MNVWSAGLIIPCNYLFTVHEVKDNIITWQVQNFQSHVIHEKLF